MTNVLITGASSGIGEALALEYAKPGNVLFLSARNAERLENVCTRARNRGAAVRSRIVDVTDQAAMAQWIHDCHAQSPLDLVIANAGVSADSLGGERNSLTQTKAMFDINVSGVFHTAFPALELMEQRGRGQIALLASQATFYGMPGAPAYCATKNAVRAWGEGMRALWADKGIQINVICPGFVDSNITRRNTFKMPFFWDAPKAAHVIAKGLARNQGRISFPWPMTALSWLGMVLPEAAMGWVAKRTPRN